MDFVPNQNVDAMALGKAWHLLSLMLPGSPGQIIGHTNIQRSVALAGEHVDEIAHSLKYLGPLPSHSLSLVLAGDDKFAI